MSYHKDHFNSSKFYSIYHSFQDNGWKLKKKHHFSHFKDNNSYKETSDNLDYRDFNWHIIRIISAIKEFGQTLHFWRYMRKTTVWLLCSIFSNGGRFFQWIKNPNINSLQDSTRNIHIKFGSSWFSSVKGEGFERNNIKNSVE